MLARLRRSLRRRAWEEEGCQVPPVDEQSASAAEAHAKTTGPATSEEDAIANSRFKVNGVTQKAAVHKAKDRVALVLNSNARSAGPGAIRRLKGLVDAADSYVCCTLEDAAHAVREVLQKESYAVVACGGGDGTLCSVINLLAREQRALVGSTPGASVPPLPPLAVLRLGTGNALSPLLGLSWHTTQDLRRLVSACKGASATGSAPPLPTLRVQLLVVSYEGTGPDGEAKSEETLCFFSGLGFDTLLLKHYHWVKRKTASNPLVRPWVHSPFGYLIAFFWRTLPATLLGKHIFRVKVTSLGEEAYYIDRTRGDFAIRKPKGAVLYEGLVGIVCFSTVPFYGGGFRLFPYAGIAPGGFAHLRLSNINPLVGVMNIATLWRGRYRNPEHVFDFFFSEVLIELDRPVPLQHSGELAGDIKRVRVRVRPGAEGGAAQLVDARALAEQAG